MRGLNLGQSPPVQRCGDFLSGSRHLDGTPPRPTHTHTFLHFRDLGDVLQRRDLVSAACVSLRWRRAGEAAQKEQTVGPQVTFHIS